MSYAIYEMDLTQPSATVTAVTVNGQHMWAIRCERCGKSAAPRPLLSAACEVQLRHGEAHIEEDRAAWSAFLDADMRSRPQLVPRHAHSDVPSKRCPQPVDRVHLSEQQQRKVSA